MAAKKKVEEDIIESPVKTKVTMVKATVETVELIGTFNELLGEHTIFHGSSLVSFVDGVAVVSVLVAEDLRKQGLVK